MWLYAPEKMTLESEKKAFRVLIIVNASYQALVSALEALQTLRKDHLQSVRVIFISFLSETLKKNLGPNILSLLPREEAETLAKAKECFDYINKPYDLKVIIVPPWNTVLDEIGDGNHDLLMLQGEFLELWRDYTARGCPYREMMESQKYSILTISWPKAASFRAIIQETE